MGCLALVTSARAAFMIQINYTGDPQYESYFTTAADAWQTQLVGYQNGAIQTAYEGSSYFGALVGEPLTTVYINATVSFIDGPGMIFGSAGPTSGILDLAGYTLATDGVMSFDSADVVDLVAAGAFYDVVRHEMAHVLGFGTLWEPNGVYSSGSGEFTGPSATAYWLSEFGQTGYPAVELGGGPGVADGHWHEIDNGAIPSGVVSEDGDLRHELMTGWLNTPTFISDLTIASFIDIGFIGSVVKAPEPSSLVTTSILIAGLGLGLKRRRAAD